MATIHNYFSNVNNIALGKKKSTAAVLQTFIRKVYI